MTVSPDRKPVVVVDLEEAIEVVRRGGLRLTSSRRLVLEALLTAREPISAEEIADGLGGKMTQSDIASVYRNLVGSFRRVEARSPVFLGSGLLFHGVA